MKNEQTKAILPKIFRDKLWILWCKAWLNVSRSNIDKMTYRCETHRLRSGCVKTLFINTKLIREMSGLRKTKPTRSLSITSLSFCSLSDSLFLYFTTRRNLLHETAWGPSFQNEALASSYFKLLNFAAWFSLLQIPSSLKSAPFSPSACLFLNLGFFALSASISRLHVKRLSPDFSCASLTYRTSLGCAVVRAAVDIRVRMWGEKKWNREKERENWRDMLSQPGPSCSACWGLRSERALASLTQIRHARLLNDCTAHRQIKREGGKEKE